MASKTKALIAVYKLLVSKPELEQRLLRMLINKIGDPDNRVASKCLTLLRNLGLNPDYFFFCHILLQCNDLVYFKMRV